MTYPFDPGDPPFGDDDIARGPGFFYRKQELLVDARDTSLVADLLPGGTEPGDVPDNLQRNVSRWVLPERSEVLEVVAELRAAPATRRLRVGPHFIMVAAAFGPELNDAPIEVAPRLHVGPGGSPLPAPPLPAAGPGAGEPVLIAVIDTGTASSALALPLLNGRLSTSVLDLDEAYLQGRQIAKVGGHGTAVAGIIARHAPNARILSLRGIEAVPKVDGKPSAVSTWADNELTVATKMRVALDERASILNMSLGTHGYRGDGPVTIKNILETVVPNDVCVVAAAGNSNTNASFYPAAFPSVLGVGALDTFSSSSPAPASFTNFGDWVDVCAPGVHIHSTYVNGNWSHFLPERVFEKEHVSWSGTSFATPHVAAWLAECSRSDRSVKEVEIELRGRHRRWPGLGPELIPPDHVVY